MKRLAILLTVSKYIEDRYINLPKVRNDKKVLKRILEETGEFEILDLNEYIQPKDVILKISEFLEKFKNEQIRDIIFYYSGHGAYVESENKDVKGFYHILYRSLFSNDIPINSLKSNDIDSIILNSNPEFYVKILDSCYSGETYIENNRITTLPDIDLNKAFSEANTMVDSGYFFDAANRNEETFIFKNKRISSLTYDFIEVINNQVTGHEIDYDDLVYGINKKHKNDKTNKPRITSSVSGAKTFLKVTEAIKEIIGEYLNE